MKYFSFNSCNTRLNLKISVLSQILSQGYLQLGYGLGFTSPTLNELLKLNLLDDVTYPIFTSIFIGGLAIGSFLSIPCSKYIGRKLTVVSSSLITTLGLLLIAGASNSVYLIAGRFLQGVGVGFSTTVLAVYLCEISPPPVRGLLSSFEGVYQVIGALIVYVFGIFLSFRWLAIVGIVVTLFNALTILFVPSSVTWLYSRGLERRAKNILISLGRSEEEVEEECSSIKLALQAKKEAKLSIFSSLKVVFKKYRLKALGVGLLSVIAFINTGTDIIYPYTSSFLEGSEIINSNLVALGVPLFGLLGAVFMIFLVEHFGRKPLLMISAVIVTLSLSSVSCFFLLDQYVFGCSNQENDTSVCNWVVFWPALSLACYNFGFQIGWGSIIYIFVGEIFPIRIKELGSGISMFVLNVYSIILLLVFSYLVIAIGNGYTFLILVLANFMSCIFIILFFPETKRLKADEIEEIFQEDSILCGLNCISQSYTLED